MRKLSLVLFVCLISAAASALAQMGQWTTYGHDPQRSGFAADEHAFSPSNVSSLGLEWKTTVPNQPLSMNGLTAPLVVRGVKSAGGEHTLVIVAGSSDHIWALDAETGELAWKIDFKLRQPRPANGDWLCPNALNDTPVIDPNRSRAFVISSDGVLHTLDLADGHDSMPPVEFVPALSKMWSLNYSGGVLYTSISQGCNRVQSGVVAMDPDAPGRPVTRFFTAANGAGVWGRGGISVGFDGNIYGVTGDAPFDPPANEFGDTVFRLAPRTLLLDGYYTPATWQYLTRHDLDMGTSTPVVFRLGTRTFTAVGGKEGAIYITDTSAMSGADHHTTALISPRLSNAQQTFESNGIWGAISTWKDAAGQMWLFVPTWGKPTQDARFPQTWGEVNDGTLMAFKVSASADHKPVLTPAWMSENIAVPEPAAIAGGVVFVLGTGEDTRQVNNGDIGQLLIRREDRKMGHAILYALDAVTGKEIWSSGDTMTGWTHFSGVAVGDGKVFVTTHDGAIYAFGLRKPGASAAKMTIVSGPAVSSAPTVNTPTNAPATYVPECADTKVPFLQQCAVCHGENGKGAPATRTPDFTDATWQASRTDAQLLESLRNGTDHGMPAFGSRLQSPQLDALIHCMVRGYAHPPQSR